MANTKLKVLTADWQNNDGAQKYEGQFIEEKVNSFCEGKEVLNITTYFNPSISTRHIAYITYKECKEKRLTISQWIDKNEVKGRLKNVLETIQDRDGVEYIDIVTPYHLTKCHNIGNKTVQEFKMLKSLQD